MKPIEFQYARALLEIADKENLARQLYDTLLKSSSEVCVSFHSLAYFFENPSLRVEDKVKKFLSLYDLESNKLLEKLFTILFANKRVRLVSSVIESYLNQYEKKHQIRRAKLYTASKLSADIITDLRKVISQKLSGLDLHFEHFVDPALLGGYKVVVDDVIINNSLDKKLKNFLSINIV